MSFAQDLIGKMNADNVDIHEADYNACGYHLEALLHQEQVRDFARNMLDQGFFLDFVTAVHVTPKFQIVYQFAHIEETCRVIAKAFALDDGSIPTISDIYHGANWHERETHDFYGVTFRDHPDLRVLLLAEEDEDLKPLLKNEDKLKDIDGITRKSTEEKPKKEKTTDKDE
jgi:NADH-quinone oxidoreductase subunit C